MTKKVCKKCWQKACEVIIYTSSQRERNSESEKSQEKPKEKRFEKNLKNFQKKVLTKEKECDILLKLSSREGSEWTLKIKQRDKKRNPRFDDRRYHQEEFLKVLFKQ